jgi:hypothetical protein
MPTLYLLAKIWSRGIGSVISRSSGSQVRSQQKFVQIAHVVSSDPVLEAEMPERAASLIELSSPQRSRAPIGLQASKVAG